MKETKRVLHWLIFILGIVLIVLGFIITKTNSFGFILVVFGIIIDFYYYIRNRNSIKRYDVDSEKFDMYGLSPHTDSFTLKQWGYLGLLFVAVVTVGIIIILIFY